MTATELPVQDFYSERLLELELPFLSSKVLESTSGDDDLMREAKDASQRNCWEDAKAIAAGGWCFRGRTS